MMTCDYCHSDSEEGATKCASCGAPLTQGGDAPDVRFCPHCKRRLLALGSPACNYCGQSLPAHYVKAREAMWQRIQDADKAGGHEALEAEGDSDLQRALRALSDLKNSKRRD